MQPESLPASSPVILCQSLWRRGKPLLLTWSATRSWSSYLLSRVLLLSLH